MQGFREECTSFMAPLAAPTHGWEEWVQAARHASELAQTARCGQASLAQIRTRLNHWQMMSKDGSSDHHSAKVWESLLCDCCRTFVEHCAEIVETSGIPSRSASNILGAAVRLAEVVGKTGLLLAAVDSDLSLMSERVQKLELLYDVLVPRVEAVAGEASVADSRAKKAEEEAGNVRKECQHLMRSLRHKCAAAEKRATELARQVAQLSRLRAARSGSSGRPSRGRGTGIAAYGRPHSSESSRHSSLPDADLDGAAEALSALQGESREWQDDNYDTWNRHTVAAEGAGEAEKAKVAPSSKNLIGQDPLDPLANFVEAALGHLLSLVKQAQQSHPTLQPEWLDDSMGLDLADLAVTAEAARDWADCALASLDPSLASSVKQSASHLRCMAELLSTSAR